MISLLVLVSLLGASTAQYTVRCECGLFNNNQFEVTTTPVPMDYTSMQDGGVNENNCFKDPALTNDCLVFCQSYFDDQSSLELCDRAIGTPRCTGSLWCESLYNSGVKNITNGVTELYYRMPDCQGTQFSEWTYGWREIKDKNLCCDNGEYFNCEAPCENCLQLNLCECGVFADAQFDYDRLDGANPLPLQNAAFNYGPPIEIYCDNWPSAEFGHPCDVQCRTAGDFFKDTVSLSAPSNRSPDVSYGQFYCQALKNRWGDQWPENGIGPMSLGTHGRMPGCNVDESGSHLRWKTGRNYACHHEQLCCAGNGNRYPCPVLDE